MKNDLPIGSTAYILKWSSGTPYIVHGKVIAVGNKKKIRMFQASDGNRMPIHEASPTIDDAVERAAVQLPAQCGIGVFGKRKLHRPWLLLGAASRLLRLVRKLQSKNLMEWKEE